MLQGRWAGPQFCGPAGPWVGSRTVAGHHHSSRALLFHLLNFPDLVCPHRPGCFCSNFPHSNRTCTPSWMFEWWQVWSSKNKTAIRQMCRGDLVPIRVVNSINIPADSRYSRSPHYIGPAQKKLATGTVGLNCQSICKKIPHALWCWSLSLWHNVHCKAEVTLQWYFALWASVPHCMHRLPPLNGPFRTVLVVFSAMVP